MLGAGRYGQLQSQQVEADPERANIRRKQDINPGLLGDEIRMNRPESRWSMSFT